MTKLISKYGAGWSDAFCSWHIRVGIDWIMYRQNTGADDQELLLVFRNRELLICEDPEERLPCISEKTRLVEERLNSPTSDFPFSPDYPADDEAYRSAEHTNEHRGFAGTRRYMARLVDERFEPPRGWKFIPLRTVITEFPLESSAIASKAAQLLYWRYNNRYCGRCGDPMRFEEAEQAMKCTDCNHTVFPRISPAIIVGVIKDGALLLARNSRFSAPRYSILAGFVEPGESLEEAVKREIREEVSIEVDSIRYFGSQPWPFPDSLMVGFTARHKSGKIRVDDEEIVEAGWYTPESLPKIPPHGSISRRIIDWYCRSV